MTSEPSPAAPKRRQRSRSSVLAQGTSAIWLTGSAMTTALVMIFALLSLVIYLGGRTFWQRPIVQVKTLSGVAHLGEVIEEASFRPTPDDLKKLPESFRQAVKEQIDDNGGVATRRKFYTGNRNTEDMGEQYKWIPDYEVVEEERPEWAVLFERVTWANFYGIPEKFLVRPETEEGQSTAKFEVTATGPEETWKEFEKHHPEVRERQKSRGEEDRYRIGMRMSNGLSVEIKLGDIVRAVPANQLGRGGKLGVYFSRWGEFLTARPRESNTEGGVMPAIWGTVAMTLIMSILVVPFGVLAALYLREYAKSGPIVSAVRIAINNLAGVPSIVFGIFGLGFFCVLVGGGIDQLFYAADLPKGPTFGTSCLFWASMTLALLTLPVVIVSTEEALASVPNSMREGSYACGASKWQTIRRIVLPRAMPGIMTGTILAIARGAGEVAPLMLVGVLKSVPTLPVDGTFPYLHADRSFMHLGFQIYDLGFQSRDSEAARPMVYTTALLLIAIVAILNFTAILLRSRLRRHFRGSQF